MVSEFSTVTLSSFYFKMIEIKTKTFFFRCSFSILVGSYLEDYPWRLEK